MPLSVSKHPLVADSLRGLRDSATEPEEFRTLARNVITMLLYEATADLPVRRYIGLERDEETAVARIYYNKLPRLKGKIPLLLDPMLATGGSAAQSLDLIKEAGGRDTRMVCIVAAPEGVKVLEERHPEVDVYTAALDERLNDKAYIVPGLGDFGDRLFGTGN